jgi:hypothetical protein
MDGDGLLGYEFLLCNNVSEEDTSSIFKAGIRSARKWKVYIGLRLASPPDVIIFPNLY